MIDWMNCYFAGGDFLNKNMECSSEFKQGIMANNGFLETAYSLHFYSQILLIEKARVLAPVTVKGGGYNIRYGGPGSVWDGTLYKTLKKSVEQLPLH